MAIKVRRVYYLRDIIASKPLSPGFMQAQGKSIVDRAKRRTLSELDDRNRQFKPLSPAYAKTKARTHPGRTILVRTGQMLDDWGVTKATGTMFRLGFTTERSAKIANYHQTGTRRMPARRLLGIPNEWSRDLRLAVRAQVRRWLRRPG